MARLTALTVPTLENLKGIADNASSNNFYRAIAIQYMADNYLLSHRLDAYALERIFVGDPYEKFLKKDLKSNDIKTIRLRSR